MIQNLDLKLNGTIPVTREELFILISSWGREFSFMTDDEIKVERSQSKECYNLSNLLHTSKHSFGISFLDSKNSYNKQLLYFTKLALICKQIIFNFYFYLVSQIEDLSYVFRESLYNGNLSKWDVSSCINMELMFCYSIFNEDLSSWDVSNVKNISYMFCGSKFNNDSLKDWNVSNVKDMTFLFNSSKFNGNISNWDISNVLSFENGFGCSIFDGDISKWNFNKNISCLNIFYDNESFKNKYNSGEKIPFDNNKFLKWFEENRTKIASLNISKNELIDIDDYLSNFESSKKELINDK